MPTTITMPQLGETVTEGTVAQWLKKIGDNVEKYEAFVEVSTDKVNAEVPAPVTGTIREFLVKEGQTVATGTPIAVIDEVASLPSPQATAAPSPAPTPRLQPAPGPSAVSSNGSAANGLPGETPETVLRGVSPAVRRLAREHHIDIRAISGSGSNGRVTADDVLAASKTGTGAAMPRTTGKAVPPSGTSTYGEPIPGTIIPLTQSRRIIAERMVESKHNAPHAWSMVEVDVTNLWKWRAREKDRFMRDTGYSLTLLPFFYARRDRIAGCISTDECQVHTRRYSGSQRCQPRYCNRLGYQSDRSGC